jgi:hypothetical protein
MKRLVLSVLFSFAVGTCNVFAQSSCSDAAEFAKGRANKFTTRGHPKSKGAVFTIKYPSAWRAAEGERPNIVQKFIGESSGGLEMAMILTKSLPAVITPAEIKEALSPANLKGMVPVGATNVRATATKIEGEPARIIEFTTRQERAGLVFDMHMITLMFFQGRSMVQLQFQVAGQSPGSVLQNRVAACRPLFQLMMNSIVFDDQWK